VISLQDTKVKDPKKKEKMKTVLIFLAALLLVNHFDGILGHGYLKDPINRASRWRVDYTAPVNYDDNGLWCGGYGVQWNKQNAGRCGLCGDNFADPTPRRNELGGTFGQGVIVQGYKAGSVIDVTVRLTANHKGYFYFRICNLDAERESDACFERYKIRTKAGADTYPLTTSAAKDYIISLQLPAGLSCKHCVMQWTYVAGNNWGYCEDGSGGRLGCGPQEHFRTCSDISISKA